MKLSVLACAVALTGCVAPYPPAPPAGYNAAPPCVSVSADQFDGSKTITQPPVGADTTPDEAVNYLGFTWNAKQPDTVVLIVQVVGIQNIESVEFNADGNIIAGLQPATAITDYDTFSTRTFYISLNQFRQIAAARVVKMQVDDVNSSGVSSFGQANPGSQINGTFAPFLAAVGQAG